MNTIILIRITKIPLIFHIFLLFQGKRYSESLAGTLLPDWIGKSLFIYFFVVLFNFLYFLYFHTTQH